MPNRNLWPSKTTRRNCAGGGQRKQCGVARENLLVNKISCPATPAEHPAALSSSIRLWCSDQSIGNSWWFSYSLSGAPWTEKLFIRVILEIANDCRIMYTNSTAAAASQDNPPTDKATPHLAEPDLNLYPHDNCWKPIFRISDQQKPAHLIRDLSPPFIHPSFGPSPLIHQSRVFRLISMMKFEFDEQRLSYFLPILVWNHSELMRVFSWRISSLIHL